MLLFFHDSVDLELIANLKNKIDFFKILVHEKLLKQYLSKIGDSKTI